MDLLERMVDLEREAEEFGFAWERSSQIMAQIKSECLEVEEHLNVEGKKTNNDLLQEEIGDLLHAVFSLCVFVNCDIKETINKTLDKFDLRLKMVKTIAKEQKIDDLNGYSFDELMQFWDEAKRRLMVLYG